MVIFGGVVSIKTISFLMFCVFAIAAVGYALGRITIKGVSLGTAGVFIVALLFGCFLYPSVGAQLTSAKEALKIVENIGLILFVTSVGFIAGPRFFGNLKRNFKSYVLLGLVIILSGALTAAACIFIGRGIGGEALNRDQLTATVVGLLAGALTSTPAFSAAKATVAPEWEDAVTAGFGIAYIFGVIGVVLFVQLMPKLTRANMEDERAKLVRADTGEGKKQYLGKLIHMDEFGFMPFALAAILGVFVGSIKIPLTSAGLSGTTFSLTTTGGCLLMALIFGHFSHFGPVNVMPTTGTLKVFRELGLMLFLTGAGVAGGASFVANFEWVYFLYGAMMTLVPMIIGFVVARYLLKMSLLNNLGSITGGMTSTPALGTLINVSGTEDVAAAYASTYPVALIAVVLVSQFLIILF